MSMHDVARASFRRAYYGGRTECRAARTSEILRYRASILTRRRIGPLLVRDGVLRRRILALADVEERKERFTDRSGGRAFYDISSTYPIAMLRERFR
jgi:hypothetical protein